MVLHPANDVTVPTQPSVEMIRFMEYILVFLSRIHAGKMDVAARESLCRILATDMTIDSTLEMLMSYFRTHMDKALAGPSVMLAESFTNIIHALFSNPRLHSLYRYHDLIQSILVSIILCRTCDTDEMFAVRKQAMFVLARWAGALHKTSRHRDELINILHQAHDASRPLVTRACSVWMMIALDAEVIPDIRDDENTFLEDKLGQPQAFSPGAAPQAPVAHDAS